MKKFVLPLLLSLVLTVGCIKTVTVPVPGAANQFDSDTYLALVTTDSVIQSAKTDLAAGKFPVAIAGNVKTALNGLVQAYNVADVTYQQYHTAALGNQATPAQQLAVQNALATVQTATAALTQAKAGK